MHSCLNAWPLSVKMMSIVPLVTRGLLSGPIRFELTVPARLTRDTQASAGILARMVLQTIDGPAPVSVRDESTLHVAASMRKYFFFP